MQYSNKTIKEVGRYFKRLVKHQPGWLKILFEADRIYFAIDPSGQLGWHVDEEIDQETIIKINTLVMRYMNKHPAPFLQQQTLH